MIRVCRRQCGEIRTPARRPAFASARCAAESFHGLPVRVAKIASVAGRSPSARHSRRASSGSISIVRRLFSVFVDDCHSPREVHWC